VTDGGRDEVGSLAEEAAKLLGALSGWAHEQGIDDHLATGAAECTVCPLCRTVSAARQVSPEVTAHLSAAASSLTQAAVAFLAAGPHSDRATHDVEHVDLADDWPEDA